MSGGPTGDDEAATRLGEQERAPEQEGGDPACWAQRVCQACGRFNEQERPRVCEACGAVFEEP